MFEIEVLASVETIVTGVYGNIKYSRGRNEHVIEYYNYKTPVYRKNGNVLLVDRIPPTIYSRFINKANKLGWLRLSKS